MLSTFAVVLLAQLAPAGRSADLLTLPVRDTIVTAQRGQRLELSTTEGDITVHAWARNQVKVELRPEDQDDEARVSIDISPRTISVGAGDRHGAPVQADYVITVPTWMPVQLNGVEGDVRMDGVQAAVSIETVQGDIDLRGGDGVISAHSVEGSVRVTGARGKIDVRSVNSDVTVTDAQGDLSAESVNGGVTLLQIQSGNVEANTVNGDIVYGGTLRSGGRYRLTTHNGDVRVGIPEGAGASIAVSTFQGDFESDFPVTLRERHGKRFSLTLGDGGAHVEIESFQGTIHLGRRSAIDSRRGH